LLENFSVKLKDLLRWDFIPPRLYQDTNKLWNQLLLSLKLSLTSPSLIPLIWNKLPKPSEHLLLPNLYSKQIKSIYFGIFSFIFILLATPITSLRSSLKLALTVSLIVETISISNSSESLRFLVLPLKNHSFNKVYLSLVPLKDPSLESPILRLLFIPALWTLNKLKQKELCWFKTPKNY